MILSTDARTPNETILAAKEVVRLVGVGLGNLICRIHRGDVNKQDWTEVDCNEARGTAVYLLGGSIGTIGYTRHLLPLIALHQIKSTDPDLGRTVKIFMPYMESAHVGAFGAYHLALPDSIKQSLRAKALNTYAQNKIPIMPLLDIGGTKVSLVLAYMDQQGDLTLDILQSHRFATPINEPPTFYSRLGSLLASPLLEAKNNDLIELMPVLAVGQPGRFEHPKSAIGVGTAKDLGPNFPGCIPAELLASALAMHSCDIDVYCANDGRSQFLGIGFLSRAKEPDKWGRFNGQKVAYLGIGTGLGAGFGRIDEKGIVSPSGMHNAFDIPAEGPLERVESRYLPRPLLEPPYLYGDLLSGKFFRRFMHEVDLFNLENNRDMIFLPSSSAKHLSRAQARALLGTNDHISPLNAMLINDLLKDEVVTARTEEAVEIRRPELQRYLIQTLSSTADELEYTLLANVRKSDYLAAIEEVARVKRRGRRVQFLGIGKSHSIGRDLNYIYNNLGIDSASCELTGADSENLTNLHDDDLVFLISNSGRAAELLDLIPYLNGKHCNTVALSGDPDSPLARKCTYFVNTFVTQNPSPISEAPTTSTTSALAAGAAIGMVVSYLFDYPAETFFLDHPNLHFRVDFPEPGVKADASFDILAKVEDIVRHFAAPIRALIDAHEFVPKMISLTKRILTSHYNGRTIFITGTGASLRVSEKIAATFTSIGIDSSAVNSAQLPHGDFAHIRSGDLLIMISYSGETRHLLEVRESARLKRVDCAVITARTGSRLAQSVPNELCVIAGEGAADTDLVPIPDQKILSSFINVAVGDALSVMLAHLLGSTSKEFAEEAHPGGAIARRNARIHRSLLQELGNDLVHSIASDATELERLNRGLPVPVDGRHLLSYQARRPVASGDVPEVMIFGMGGVGLAYLAPLLSDLGTTIWFVESKQARIEAMKNVHYRYQVRQVGLGGTYQERRIGRVSVISSQDHTAILEHALRVDLIITAVGVGNIEALIPMLANIVRLRHELWLEEPLNVMFNENFPVEEDPLARLRHTLREMLDSAELKVYFDDYVGLVPAIDEAIVPEVPADSLDKPIPIEAETSMLFVDRRKWRIRAPQSGSVRVGSPILSKHVTFTTSFLPLHMRKLWVHNMGHALIGYLGYFAGHKLAAEAAADPRIERLTKRAMLAIGRELYRRWSYRDTQQPTLEEYVEWRWARYANDTLGDPLSRICRDPLRKLKRDDRLLGAVNYIRKYASPGPNSDNALVDILVGVVAAIRYVGETEKSDLNLLRSRVLGDLVNIDSALLTRAEQLFGEMFGHG